jgi:hypothetical protein
VVLAVGPSSTARALVLGGVMALPLARKNRLASSRSSFKVKCIMAVVAISHLDELWESN